MIIVCLLIVLFIVIITIMLISYFKIDVSSYDVEDEKIDKNMKIMLLSDLHNRNIKDKLKDIIKKEDPDIIVLAGDMVNNYPKESKNFINTISIFKEYKTFYTFGNHEDEIKDKTGFYKKIFNSNMIILNNLKCNLTLNIRLFGLHSEQNDEIKYRNIKLSNKYINDRLGMIDENNYNILIAHNPLDASHYDDYGFDLVLSGHVHGGLVILPFLGGLFSPEFKFFPKYYKGVYNLKKTKLVVSRGLGFSTRLKFRMFNPAEVVIINLMKKK